MLQSFICRLPIKSNKYRIFKNPQNNFLASKRLVQSSNHQAGLLVRLPLSSRSFCNAQHKPSPNQTTQQTSTSTTTPSTPPLSTQNKFKALIARYGKIGIVVHTSISLTAFACWYTAIKNGVDVGHLLNSVGLGSAHLQEKLSSNVGAFAIALIIHKLTIPIRLPITLTLTPIVSRVLKLNENKQTIQSKG